MTKPPKAFDVWFVTANTVYKGVPYNVVADWTQQGRLAGTDMVRPAGATEAWAKIEANEFLIDYLARPSVGKAVPAAVATAPTVTQEVATAVAEPIELPEPEDLPRTVHGDDDDEVDMIPLIDVSMVLLVFFILMRAAGALAPVDVPEMVYAGELSNDPEAITINIDKLDEFNVYYSVRQGQQPPKPENDKLKTPEEALRAMDDLLALTTKSPEVRIACRKELPCERVREFVSELEARRKKNMINSYSATVIEAPKK